MMKSNKEVSSILANITEMVLQARISPTPQQLLRIETVRSEIEVLRSHMSPSDEVLYFLIDRQYYQIRNKITASLRRNTLAPLTLLLTFTLFDKETSLAETAQIWKIQLIRKQVTTLRPTECTKELLLLIREVTGQLTSPYPFSEATRNKDTNKKYVIDFKVDLWAADQPTKGKYFQRDYRMKECRGRMNELFQLRVGCYWRENIPIIPFVLSTSAGGKGRKASEQTRGDSGSIGSQKDMPMKKYRSIDEQQQAFQFYDPELDVTILSSDSDSLSHSRKVMNELTVGEVDEFQLLIEEDTDEDEMFVMQNEGNFQNWQKYLLLNFH